MFQRLWALSATKFLSNLNDNAFKTLAIFIAVSHLEGDKGAQAAVIAFGSIVFMLPFVAFPTVAGWMSDRFAKRQVIVGAKVAEVVIMLLGAVALARVDQFGLGLLFVAVFMMALQSTFLSPAFLGVLPEVFTERELSKANGIVDLVAFLGIILGCGLGGVIKISVLPPWLYGLPFLAAAGVGVVTALRIPRTQVARATEPIGWHLVTRYFSDMKLIAVSRPVLLCVLGNAVFMSVGTLILASLVSFGEQELGLHEGQIAALQVASAIGIGLGCFIAGSFSHEKVEFGLVPIGCYGMTIFFINLWLTLTFHWALVNVFMIGLFGGFFVLPLIVYIQQRTPESVRGRTLAQTNAVAFWGALIVSVLMLVLTGGMTEQTTEAMDFWARVRANFFFVLGPRELYAGAAVFLLVTSSYVFYLLPDFLIRLMVVLMTRFCYKLRVYGQDRLPRRGPALLLANHVSAIDGLLLTAASSRRLYFVINEETARHPLVKPFAKWARLIPLASSQNPKGLQRSLDRIRAVLQGGSVVCVFPEGELTPDGMMLEFRRGYLKMLPEELEVPIIPVHIGLMWGSIFSRRFGEIRLRRPRQFPYPVILSFGAPLSRNATPHEVRLAIQEAGSDAESNPTPGERVLAEQFIRLAHRQPFRKLLADSSGTELSALSALIRAYVLAAEIRRDAESSEEYIGIMLPPTTTGAIMAIAVMLTDRIPIYLNFTASRDGLQYAIATCEIKRIYTSRAFIEKAGLEARDEMIFLEDRAAGIGRGAKLGAACRALFLPAALARGSYFPRTGRTVHNVATVLFSSGSTGVPKGAVLTHHNFTANVSATLRILGLEKSDRMLGSLPFFHSFGFLATLWLPMTWGVPVLYHPNPVDAATIGELVEKHKLSVLFATPTFLQGYVRKCRPDQLRSLRIVVTGAEKLRQGIADKFAETFGVVPMEGYGTTELSPVVSVNMPARFDQIGKAVGRPGSVGKPLPGITARIVDPSTLRTLAIEQEGLLWIKGPNVMRGYLREPEKSAEVLHDRWYDTGDMARIDRDGYLYITGRLSRFSKIGGEMVPHIALENEIHHALGSRDTQVAVTAVPDDKRGERLIILHLPLQVAPIEIIARLRERGLPNLWLPKASDFHQIESIPHLGSGKLDLRSMQELARDAANSASDSEEQQT